MTAASLWAQASIPNRSFQHFNPTGFSLHAVDVDCLLSGWTERAKRSQFTALNFRTPLACHPRIKQRVFLADCTKTPVLLPSPSPEHVFVQQHNNGDEQVVFADGQTESVVSLPIVHDNDQDEGCESVTLGVAAVTGNGLAVVDGGIHDVSAEAAVRIEESDFTSAVLDTVPPEGMDVAAGGLSPATARVGGWVGG